jgi:hypothetical protein
LILIFAGDREFPFAQDIKSHADANRYGLLPLTNWRNWQLAELAKPAKLTNGHISPKENP